MAHIHRVYDTDGHFIINADTRLLENASAARVNLVQYDHNSERVTFELERYVDGHDMSTCNRVEVIFTNKGTGGTSKGRYIVADLQIAPDDEDVVVFSWLISQAATRYDGALSFGVRFICTSEAGVLDYAWNTATYTGLTVSKGSGDASADETYVYDSLQVEIDKRAVRYDAPQDLTDEQRKQVWANIGLPEEEEEEDEVIPATVVTPEQYGAVGDGVHDDAPALKAALESGLPVLLTQDLWLQSETIITDHNVDLDGQGHTLHCNNGCLTFRASSWDGSPILESTTAPLAVTRDAMARPAVQAVSAITPVQSGSGNPSPDNVRPITGWDTAVLMHAGRNLVRYPYDNTTMTRNGITFTDNGDGTVTANGTATDRATFYLCSVEHPIHLKKGCSYTLTGAPGVSGAILYMQDTTFKQMVAHPINPNTTITADYSEYYMFLRVEAGATLDNAVFRPMLVMGDTAQEFEPYQGQTLSADLPETVYSGTLDWTTGTLTVARKGVRLTGEEDWTELTTGIPDGQHAYQWRPKDYATGKLSGLCSHYTVNRESYRIVNVIYFGNRITVNTVQETVADFKAWLAAQVEANTPVTVVYELAAPYTIQLTPQQLQLLKGNNALWSTTGDTSISYWAEAVDRVGACSKVSSTTQSEYEADRSPYFRGYLTYKGRKTLQEDYEDYSRTYFDIYSARLRNFAMVCENMDYGNGKGMCALSLYYLCNSSVENVRTVLKDGEEGSAGICAIYCQNLRIDRCHSAGWTAAKNGAIADVRGYGIQVMGDNISISRCSGEQNKHCVTVGSSHDCWSTNITIDHCNFRTDFTKLQRADGSCYYMQQIDVHGDARNVTITGCNFYWWALDGNSMSAAVLAFRNPTTQISNCSVHSNGAWINFGEFAESIHIDQLYAPEVHLTTDYRIGGDRNKTHFLPELHVSNSEFARLRDSSSPTRVYLTGCVIREILVDVQYLVARGCVFSRELAWSGQPTMVLTGESILSDCIIYGHRENAISKRVPVIRAPKNSVHMSHCKIYKRQGDYPTFDTEQDEGVGNWYEDVFALYLDTQSELNKNTLQ